MPFVDLQLQVSIHRNVLGNAMGKRLRSLASILWESDSEQVEQADSYFGVANSRQNQWRELQLENDFLKSKVQQLSSEIEGLRKQIGILSLPPKEMAPIDFGPCGTNERWIHNLRREVVGLLRLHREVLPELKDSGYCSGRITFDLPNAKANASQVTRHCENSIRKLSTKYPVVFKLGITANPVRRWMHPTYGYALDRIERWQGMKVFSATSHSFSAALLEGFMISLFKGTPGCRNEKPGGESACPGEGPHFTYVVFRVLEPPMVRATALPRSGS